MIETTGFGEGSSAMTAGSCNACICDMCTQPDCCSCIGGSGSYSSQVGDKVDQLTVTGNYDN